MNTARDLVVPCGPIVPCGTPNKSDLLGDMDLSFMLYIRLVM